MPDPKEVDVSESPYDPNKYYTQLQRVRDEEPKENEKLPISYELVEDPNED